MARSPAEPEGSFPDDRRTAAKRARRGPIQLVKGEAGIRGEAGRRQLRQELTFGQETLRLTGELREHERLACDRRGLRRQRGAREGEDEERRSRAFFFQAEGGIRDRSRHSC